MTKPSQSTQPSGPQWITGSGVKVPAVTEAQMREVDRIAVEETGPNLFQMMENAGRNLALAAIGMLEDDWREARVLVLAGSGGNGGGGICAARHLANRNVDVTVCLADAERLGEVPSFQLKVYKETAGAVAKSAQPAFNGANIILDALIGYSLRGAPGGITAELIGWANECEAAVLSLDIPSGVESTTGETPGIVIQPSGTLTLALPKTGLNETNAGDVILADIGIPMGVYRRMGLDYENPFDNRFSVPISPVVGG
ncbi:MAG: NAD(P)H-hydrate epimerase [SAR324 cluster bacterium]|nr:NAD(P)H-hydrate epimerase [SAR324 cluster bacterium]MCZ6646847.1 NAD(P)H-hydrate epimerase [SAR324 cluster bacterium]